MKNFALILLMLTVFASCSKPEARKPIVRKTGSFINESIERNKRLNSAENALLMEKMQRDSLHEYINSANGFWYYYDKKVDADTSLPNRGDEVFYTHEIIKLNDSILYSGEDLGTKSYLVDQEDLISGLQDGIKLMKEGETVSFLFPSYKAYGYTGFDKVGSNEPLIYKVQLIKINKLSKNESN
jgi:gliding motility-associated peptidyl-prolyl isomerase